MSPFAIWPYLAGWFAPMVIARSASSSPWSRVERPAGYDLGREKQIDPYLVWAELSNFAAFGGEAPTSISVIFELESSASVDGDRTLREFIDDLRRGNPLNGQSRFATAHTVPSSLSKLSAAVAAGLLRRFQLSSARAPSVPQQSASSPILASTNLVRTDIVGPPPTGPFVTLGIVDDGCCLAHERLRPGGRTRFLYVWDQSRNSPGEKPWRQFPGINYGRELSARQINRLLTLYPNLGELEERKVYQTLGRSDWGSDGRKHGAGVAHLLISNASVSVATDTATQPDSPLIFVQLPATTVADTSGGSLGLHVIDGARYVVQRTKETAAALGFKEWKTIINISLGSVAGPHDGSTIAEMALTELASDGIVQIVIAAGNAANWKVHAKRTISLDRPGRFDVMVPPDNPRETYVEVWLPEVGVSGTPIRPDQFTIEAISPSGVRSGPVTVGQAALYGSGDRVSASVLFARRAAQGNTGTMILLAFRATNADAIVPSEAPPYGVWSITMSLRGEDRAEVHAWVERNDVIVGRRAPQRSYFVDDATEYVGSQFTLGSIANGSNVAIVGAYRVADGTIAEYSGSGPTRGSTGRLGPDYFGPSDESAFLPGVQVPGFYSGSFTRMSGTSIAAPQIARWIADGAPTVRVQESLERPDGRAQAFLRVG